MTLGIAPEAYLDADARSGPSPNGKPSYTIDQAAWQIIRGEPGWSGVLGQGFTITYAFRATAPATMPSDATGFQRFNAAQINQTELALKAWSDVADIHFMRVGSGISGEGAYSDNAAILLGDYSSGVSGAAAFSYFPGSTDPASPDGDVWVNGSLAYNASPTTGNYGGLVLVHELGHAIGLAHPSDYDASVDAPPTYTASASYYEDDRQYTVMSYFSEGNTGANFQGSYAAAPMVDDIAAAQLEYGRSNVVRAGDTIYGFHSNADAPWYVATSSLSKLVFTAWDPAGWDTFDFSGYSQNQLIDLAPGDFSNVGGLIGNVAIAQNVVIENAFGGAGADVIHGNAANNSIEGGGGADTIDGGSGGSDQLMGGDGPDSVQGGAGFDIINGNKGSDTVDGGAGGDDWLFGGQSNDLITAHAGNVVENGNLGDDTVNGGVGDDLVRGGQGADVLNGGAGADQLYGDLGNDTLTGGDGADVFHFSPGRGADRILDFNYAQGDRIELDGVTSYTVSPSGGDTVISMGPGDQITLAGVPASSLPPGAILLA